MKKIGLSDLLNVSGVAGMRGDKKFSKEMDRKINKIEIEISDEDYEYILKNYTE